jgi:DNA-directed RNA polymerase beta' subunit
MRIWVQTLFGAGDINYRHLGLLVDVMCRSGRLMSVDRYGINKLNIGPLAKASFEETERILLKAAVFGEVDPVTGVSSNIMTGQTIRGGTAFADILLDEVAVMRLQKNLPPAGALDVEDESPTEDEVNAELEYDPNDICSVTRLKMNMAMPKSNVNIEEDDVELVEIAATGEE